MTTYTITTAVNIDSLMSKAGDDTYNVNGGALTIDQDSRYGVEQNTSATLGAVTLSATLGGSLTIDARYVRLIPYDTGSGVVPASGTTISQGGASGTLIGVWSAVNVAPTAAAAAMPASGFIKVKGWNQVAYAAGALTGIGANATGADVPGWIELVGAQTRGVTASRLNTITTRGDFYTLGTTDGNNATTYQLPTSGSNIYLPGVWVETGSTTNVYEFYPCANGISALAASMATDATRGKVCWISTAGVVRFQNDGTNSTGGYLPPSGRRVRIPNIILQEATTGAPTVNAAPHATLATRYDWTTSGGPAVDLQNLTGTWYANLTQAYSVAAQDVSFMAQLLLSKNISSTTLTRCSVSHYSTSDTTSTGTLTVANCQQGGTVTDCHFSRSLWAANSYALNVSDSVNWTFDNCVFRGVVSRTGSTNGAQIVQRCQTFTFTDCALNGLCLLNYTTDFTYTNSTYWDPVAGMTPSTIPVFIWSTVGAANTVVDGLLIPEVGTAPYSGVITPSANSTGTVVRNIGSYASPLNLGGAEAEDLAWSRSGTTGTLTWVAHGLVTGDTFYVYQSSDTSAVTVGAKTILSTPTADTLTWTVVNAGATSGTVSVNHVISGYFWQISNSSACDGLQVNRVYVKNLRTGSHTVDNSTRNLTFQDYRPGIVFTPVMNANNMTWLNSASPISLVAQSSVYGTHWFSSDVTEVQAGNSATWTRSGAVVTVTMADHKLRSNTGAIAVVTVSSDEAALPLLDRTVATSLSADVFTLTGVNTGSASGTATIEIANTRVGVHMNEETSDTSDTYEILAGTPAFTSAGSLSMPAVDDEIRFTSPEIKGQSTFLPLQPAMAGGTLTNHDMWYQIDPLDGSGWTTEAPLRVNYPNSTTVSSSTSLTLTTTTGIAAGDFLYAGQIPTGTTVVSVDSGTTLTMSTAATSGSSAVNVGVCRLATETVPATGFQFRWRIKTTVPNVAVITSIYVHGQNTDTDRAEQYPLPLPQTNFSITNLVDGTQVIIFDDSDYSELLRETAGVSGIVSYDYLPVDPAVTATVLIWHEDYVSIKLTAIELDTTDQSLFITQVADLIYDAAHDDRYTLDFANERIVMATGETVLDVPGIYSHWKQALPTSDNAQYDFAFSIAGGDTISGAKSIPPYVFVENGWKIRPDEADHTLSVVNGILVGESGGDPFLDTLGAYTVRVLYEQPVQAITVNTGGGGGATALEVWTYGSRSLSTSPPTAAAIADAVWDETVADHLTAGTTGRKVSDIPTTTYTVPTSSDIADAVWDEPTAGHETADTFGLRATLIEKILRNRTVTDPATGVITVYDDDNTTPLLTGDLFEDAAGTTPYDGGGAERRDRLE